MIKQYKKACLKISADPQMPARIVDWADLLYMNFDGYNNQGRRQDDLMIRIEDLRLLDKFIECDEAGVDDGYAISLIDSALCKR